MRPTRLPSTPTETSPLLSLAAELRNTVYRYALVSADPIETCKQVYQEASQIFYAENTFHYTALDGDCGPLASWLVSIGKKNAHAISRIVIGHKVSRAALDMMVEEQVNKEVFDRHNCRGSPNQQYDSSFVQMEAGSGRLRDVITDFGLSPNIFALPVPWTYCDSTLSYLPAYRLWGMKIYSDLAECLLEKGVIPGVHDYLGVHEDYRPDRAQHGPNGGDCWLCHDETEVKTMVPSSPLFRREVRRAWLRLTG
ncbi:hypothetical protein LTR37_012198 [Vermiconidia calcicola]|uniref:Uncharacterized protein n=1 Tax=Vermiconidia calcicola TaxID=1690605 RepID=A0ACC3N2V7_9PEZI|nr:hypothetical protein LTR37_012198 [Vermiconidia calcicola]